MKLPLLRLSLPVAVASVLAATTNGARAASLDLTLAPPAARLDLTLAPPVTSLPLPPVRDSLCLRTHAAVRGVTNGQGIVADALCSRAYVLPPIAGTVTVAQLAATPNVQQCPLILGLHTQIDTVLQEIATIQAQIDAYLDQVGELDAQLETLGDQLATTSVASSSADATLVNDTNNQTVLMGQLQSAQNAYASCVALEASPSDCATLQTGVANAQAALNAYTTGTVAPAQAASTAADAAYASALDAYDNILDELDDALDPIIDLVAQLADVDTTVLSTYQSYAGLEGATGSLSFSVPWTPLVASYRAANPADTWSWSPIPIDTATLSATANIGGDATSIPALLDATLPGSVDGGANPGTVLLSGGTETATITLSLVGACPYFPSGDPKAPGVSVDSKGLAAYVSANLTYTYPVEVMTSYAKLLGASPLATKLKAAGIDPLGPTPAATLVQSTVSAQAFQGEMALRGVQHTALLTTLQSGTTQLQRVVLKVPVAPVALYTKVEQTGTLTFVP